MRAYSMDLRERVVADCDAGLGTQAVADKYRVSTAWVRRLKQRRRESGSIAPRPQRHGPAPALTDAHRARLAELVRRQPDATLAELRNRLGAAVGVTTVWAALKRLGLALKKKSSGRPSRTGRT